MKATGVVLLLLAWLGCNADTPAASLLRLDLIPDGSASPPGDRLTVAVFFRPDDGALTLEVRAFVVSGERKDKSEPVPSANKANRGDKGNFLLRTTVNKPGVGNTATAEIVVPYEDLGLPKGVHQFAYEVTGRRGDVTDFVAPSRLTIITIGDGVRNKMLVHKMVSESAIQKTTTTAHLVTRPAKGDLDVRPQELEVSIDRPVHKLVVTEEAVAIPRGCERAEPIRAIAKTIDAPRDPREQFLSALEDQPFAALSDFVPKDKRFIYFATNRKLEAPKAAPAKRFGFELSPGVTYGFCLVNIPIKNHKSGNTEVPSWWQQRDPSRFFLLETLNTFGAQQFSEVVKASEGDILLHIHGFNNTFEEAALRTAQLNHDLAFPGRVMFFSWPARGGGWRGTANYRDDEKTAAKSGPALAQVLQNLLANRPARPDGKPAKIHLLAHSMGNRVLLDALQIIAPKEANKQFGHIVFAAPDIGALDFARMIGSARRASDALTLYYCDADVALNASRVVGLDKRVGSGPFFFEGLELDNVDCTNANTSILGHDYYSSSPKLHLDLQGLVVFDKRPPGLRGLTEQKSPPSFLYWTIP